MTEQIQEFTDSRGVAVRVNRQTGVLEGVKLIGLASRNGRRYRETALQQAASLYEEAKVNVNHSKEGPLAPRDYQDRLGVIRNVEFRPAEGLFGNLHFNPKHALAEQLMWDAKHNPRNVGFSHNVYARLSRDETDVLVEEITHVQSVDLVADPATTKGLYEQAGNDGAGDLPQERWDALTAETLRLHRPDLYKELCEQRHRELLEQLTHYQRKERISDLLQRHQLQLRSTHPLHSAQEGIVGVIGPAFYDMLLSVEEEDQLEKLIAERAEMMRNNAAWPGKSRQQSVPRSREQFALGEQRSPVVESPRDFARALKTN